MAPDPVSVSAARTAAEEILQAIYGDDLSGCSVRLDSIVGIVATAIDRASENQREMLALLEKTLEALHLLSTPPTQVEGLEPDGLRMLLSERLDAIREISNKVISTTAAVRTQLSIVEPAP